MSKCFVHEPRVCLRQSIPDTWKCGCYEKELDNNDRQTKEQEKKKDQTNQCCFIFASDIRKPFQLENSCHIIHKLQIISICTIFQDLKLGDFLLN